MPESEFLCLAVSRCCKEYYAAGLDLGTGAWVRLVGSRPDLRFNGVDLGQLRVEGMGARRRMRPLDVVRIPLGERVPTRSHPENQILDHSITDGPIPLLSNAAHDASLVGTIREWAEASGKADLLFGTENTSNPVAANDKSPISLFVVHSEHLWWRMTGEYTKSRSTSDLGSGPFIQGRFDFGIDNQRYCLPAGDPAWELTARTNIPSDRFIENTKLNELLGIPSEIDTLLTISFDDDVIKFDQRFKFIAGVLHLPKQW